MELNESMMILHARNNAPNSMSLSVTGNLGADNFGKKLTFTFVSSNLKAFVTSVCGTSDPSVNHMFIVDTALSPGVTFATNLTNTDDETDTVSNIAPHTPFTYILYSTKSGSCMRHDEHLALFNSATGCVGSCAIKPNEYICECPAGFDGARCQHQFDECARKPCKNGATCTDTHDDPSISLASYRCTCAPGFANGKCNYNFISEYTKECNVLESPVSAKCVDKAGWRDKNGNTCAKWGGSSSGNLPCSLASVMGGSNGLTAADACCACRQKPSVNSTNTTLLTGNCDIDVDECKSNPCKNGAICTESSVDATISPNSYRCSCAPGYANGVCNYSYINEYKTECTVAESTHVSSMSGNCDVDVDECKSSPCLNGGLCSESIMDATISINAYRCSCSRGFTNGLCTYKYLPEYEITCNVMESDDGLPTNCDAPAKWCEPIFLGEEIGWASVFLWNDADQDCALDMVELTKICSEFYEECLAYLYGTLPQPTITNKCAPIYLGEDVGFMDVYGFFDANGDCIMNEQEIAAMCAQYEDMCLSFIGIKRKPDPCAPIFLGADSGWGDIFKYYDNGDCIMQTSELAQMCAAVPDLCRSFLNSGSRPCKPQPLGSGATWATTFSNYSNTVCNLNTTQVQTFCASDAPACAAFGDFSSCTSLYLGDGIGFSSVYSIVNGSCTLDLGQLSTACVRYPKQCTTFLQAGNCLPMWLGSSIGYADVYTVNPQTKQCVLDRSKLTSACATVSGGASACERKLTKDGCPAGWYDPDMSVTTGCLPCQAGTFSTARSQNCTLCPPGYADTDKNPGTPCQKCAQGTTSQQGSTVCVTSLNLCPAVNLGPNVGVRDVFDYSSQSGSCNVNPTKLVAVCGSYYAECLAFIGNIGRACDPLYLGSKLGWQSVLSYDAALSKCTVNYGDLRTVCTGNVGLCAAYLQSSHGKQCDPVYLGPKTGWAFVKTLQAGKCSVDTNLLRTACGTQNLPECRKFASSTSVSVGNECQPLWLGDAVGFKNVFSYISASKTCTLDINQFKQECRGHEDACVYALSFATRGISG